MSKAASLSIKGASRIYGRDTALAGVDLEAPAGAYVVLLGPSGSGKTTLLSIIGGFTEPSAGRVLIGGTDVTDLKPALRPTATVFQDYALFPHLDVAGNVGFGLSIRREPAPSRAAKVEAALGLVGLQGYGGRAIAALSGGQRQRVALARALVVEPAILLLDEPLGALDLHLRRQMQDELKSLQRQTGRSFVHVTHDQEEAMALADIIVVMNKGRIEDMGPPTRVYAQPATRFTASFMGESTLIEGRVVAGGIVETADGRIAAPSAGAIGRAVGLSIRPERIAATGDAAGGRVLLAEATVTEIVFQGGFVRVKAMSDAGTRLLAKLAPEAAPAIGARIALTANPADIVVLDA